MQDRDEHTGRTSAALAAEDARVELAALRQQLARAEAEVEAGLSSVSDLYEELATLYRVGETLAQTTHHDALITGITQLVVDAVESDCAFLLLPTGDAYTFHCATPCGEPAACSGRDIVLGQDETLLLRCLEQSGAVIVNDFGEDQRFNSPLCGELGLERALAARFADSESAGLFLLGRRPGCDIFTAGHAKMLTSLAGSLSNFLENDRLRRQELVRHKMEQQLEIARGMQRMLLPRGAPKHPVFRADGRNAMAREVGGDYYQFYGFDADRYGLMVGDVSGKGVPAALLMTMLKGVLTGLPAEELTPGETLTRLNAAMHNDRLSDKFVTMAYVICNAAEETLHYASAGHEPVLVLRADGQLDSLRSLDLPLGLLPEQVFQSATAPLHPGDLVVLYTDGVVEARNGAGEFFEQQRFEAVLRAHRGRPVAEIIDAVEAAVADFVGDEEQFDDLTIAMLYYSSGEDDA